MRRRMLPVFVQNHIKIIPVILFFSKIEKRSVHELQVPAVGCAREVFVCTKELPEQLSLRSRSGSSRSNKRIAMKPKRIVGSNSMNNNENTHI